MNEHEDHSKEARDPAINGRGGTPMSRRRFLALSGVGGAAMSWDPLGALAGDKPPLQLPIGSEPSRVFQVRADRVISDGAVVRQIVGEMLDAAITGLTGATTPALAWRQILRPDDVVGIKFNRSGQRILGTTTSFAPVLIESLVDSGFKPRQIVCMEAPPGVEERYGTTPAIVGFESETTDFGSGADQLALALRQVTTLIDVPFCKTHNIAGMTGCLKNLSHGLIKHPARYHGGRCTPYIADIAGLPQIKGKLRLCLVDALRVVFDNGPIPTSAGTAAAGVLLASTDPVAADVLALETINRTRRAEGLAFIRDRAAGEARLIFLDDAHRKGLGIALRRGIEVGLQSI